MSGPVIILPGPGAGAGAGASAAAQTQYLNAMVRAIIMGGGALTAAAGGPSGARRSTVPFRCQEAWATCPRGFPYCYWGHGAHQGKCCLKPWSSLCVPAQPGPGEVGPRVAAAQAAQSNLSGGLPGGLPGGLGLPRAGRAAVGGGAGLPAPTGGANPYADGQWRRATATWYSAYPECCDNKAVDQTECVKYSGCRWKGQFAGVQGPRSRQWVMQNNLVAFFDKNNAHNKQTWPRMWKGRKLRIRTPENPNNVMVVTIVDTCDDNDTFDKATCTRNASKNGNGFLVDLEEHTARRFYNGRIQDMKTIQWQLV
jgi:hypothetical protein